MQDMPFERILVTGGTGFIGRYIVRRLVDAGHRPTVVQFGPMPDDFLDAANVSLIDLDLRDHQAVGRLIGELVPDLVIHLAGVTGQADPDGRLCDEINFRATAHLLDCLRGSCKVVMPGTAAEYGGQATPFREDMPVDPRSPYAASRAKATQYALELAAKSELSVTVLRFFSVYGIGQPANMFLPQLISRAVTNAEFRMTDGTQVRDFVHVDDVARAILLAAAVSAANGRVLNIASGTGSSLASVAMAVWEYCRADAALLKIGALTAEGEAAFDTLADIRAAADLLGWGPRRGFLGSDGPIDALVEMIEHMREGTGA